MTLSQVIEELKKHCEIAFQVMPSDDEEWNCVVYAIPLWSYMPHLRKLEIIEMQHGFQEAGLVINHNESTNLYQINF